MRKSDYKFQDEKGMIKALHTLKSRISASQGTMRFTEIIEVLEHIKSKAISNLILTTKVRDSIDLYINRIVKEHADINSTEHRRIIGLIIKKIDTVGSQR